MPNGRRPRVPVVPVAAVLGAKILVVLTSAGPSAPAPVRVSFGPNLNLSVGSNSNGGLQTESSIAANPRDARNLVEGNFGKPRNGEGLKCSHSFTFDGGSTWNFGRLLPLQVDTDSSIDPAVAADANGNFYYGYIEFGGSQGGERIDRLLVARSTDGGRTFPAFSIVTQGTFGTQIPDKDYLTVDNGSKSPFRGTIYIAWTDIRFVGSQFVRRIVVARSRDSAATWSEPVPIGVPPQPSTVNHVLIGAIPVVASDGTVYVFYADFTAGTGPTSIRFSRSTDGGWTWTAPASVASDLPSPGFFNLKDSDPSFGTKEFPGISANSFPAAAVAPDGTLFVAWVDFSEGSCGVGSLTPPCVNSDVVWTDMRSGQQDVYTATGQFAR